MRPRGSPGSNLGSGDAATRAPGTVGKEGKPAAAIPFPPLTAPRLSPRVCRLAVPPPLAQVRCGRLAVAARPHAATPFHAARAKKARSYVIRFIVSRNPPRSAAAASAEAPINRNYVKSCHRLKSGPRFCPVAPGSSALCACPPPAQTPLAAALQRAHPARATGYWPCGRFRRPACAGVRSGLPGKPSGGSPRVARPSRHKARRRPPPKRGRIPPPSLRWAPHPDFMAT